MRLILYSKPGCHLCEGLQEKLEQIQNLQLELEIRDITTRDDWFAAYQYEVPVLFVVNPRVDEGQNTHPTNATEESMQLIPRPSPRATVQQLEKILRKYQ